MRQGKSNTKFFRNDSNSEYRRRTSISYKREEVSVFVTELMETDWIGRPQSVSCRQYSPLRCLQGSSQLPE